MAESGKPDEQRRTLCWITQFNVAKLVSEGTPV